MRAATPTSQLHTPVRSRCVVVSRSGLSLVPPPIDGDPASVMDSLGAEFDDEGVPTTFHNDDEVARGLREGFVVFSRSHDTRVRVSGEQRWPHLLSCGATPAVSRPATGSGMELELRGARGLLLALSSSFMLLLPSAVDGVAALSPCPPSVSVSDVRDATAVFAVAGPGVPGVLERISAASLCNAPVGDHLLLSFRDAPLLAAVAPRLGSAFECIYLVADEAEAGSLYELLCGATFGGVPAGEKVWQEISEEAAAT